jgi:hypothetical protein
MTHDYKRSGTTTLFAALNALDGTVIGRCMDEHRYLEFIRFLKAVERGVHAGKVISAGRSISLRHRRHGSTPLNVFSTITRRKIRRGVVKSAPDYKTPSPAASRPTIKRRGGSSGPARRMQSSKSPLEFLNLPDESGQWKPIDGSVCRSLTAAESCGR